jgi:hypothetical protein
MMNSEDQLLQQMIAITGYRLYRRIKVNLPPAGYPGSIEL